MRVCLCPVLVDYCMWIGACVCVHYSRHYFWTVLYRTQLQLMSGLNFELQTRTKKYYVSGLHFDLHARSKKILRSQHSNFAPMRARPTKTQTHTIIFWCLGKNSTKNSTLAAQRQSKSTGCDLMTCTLLNGRLFTLVLHRGKCLFALAIVLESAHCTATRGKTLT